MIRIIVCCCSVRRDPKIQILCGSRFIGGSFSSYFRKNHLCENWRIVAIILYTCISCTGHQRGPHSGSICICVLRSKKGKRLGLQVVFTTTHYPAQCNGKSSCYCCFLNYTFHIHELERLKIKIYPKLIYSRRDSCGNSPIAGSVPVLRIPELPIRSIKSDICYREIHLETFNFCFLGNGLRNCVSECYVIKADKGGFSIN